jgi:hypothetical protein
VRRFFALITLALAAPAAAYAVDAGVGDGTLEISSATGTISIAVRGALIGRIDKGSVTLDDPDPTDGKAPVVWGFESRRDLTDTKSRYAGSDIRFRVIGGFFRARITGTGMNLSIVGKGSVTIAPNSSGLAAGTYSLNGDPETPLPSFLTTLQLGAPTTP